MKKLCTVIISLIVSGLWYFGASECQADYRWFFRFTAGFFMFTGILNTTDSIFEWIDSNNKEEHADK